MISRTSLKVSLSASVLVASAFVWVACSSSTPVAAGGDGGASSSSGGSNPGTGSSSGTSAGSSSGVTGGSSGAATGSSSGSASGSSSGASGDAGAVCPQAACPTGTTCCADLTDQTTACSSDCAPADLVACTGAADCAGSDAGNECCATAILNKGPDGGNSFPHGCTVESVNSYCGSCNNAPLALGSPALTCQTNGDASVEYVHVCRTAADCATETINTECCPVFSYNICLSSALATIGGVTGCMQ